MLKKVYIKKKDKVEFLKVIRYLNIQIDKNRFPIEVMRVVLKILLDIFKRFKI